MTRLNFSPLKEFVLSFFTAVLSVMRHPVSLSILTSADVMRAGVALHEVGLAVVVIFTVAVSTAPLVGSTWSLRALRHLLIASTNAVAATSFLFPAGTEGVVGAAEACQPHWRMLLAIGLFFFSTDLVAHHVHGRRKKRIQPIGSGVIRNNQPVYLGVFTVEPGEAEVLVIARVLGATIPPSFTAELHNGSNAITATAEAYGGLASWEGCLKPATYFLFVRADVCRETAFRVTGWAEITEAKHRSFADQGLFPQTLGPSTDNASSGPSFEGSATLLAVNSQSVKTDAKSSETHPSVLPAGRLAEDVHQRDRGFSEHRK